MSASPPDEPQADGPMLDRRSYLHARGRNWIVLGAVFAVLTAILLATGSTAGAGATGFLLLVCVLGYRRFTGVLRQLKAEGKMDPTWPVV